MLGVGVGVFLMLAGAVWALQGVGSRAVPVSFMTDDRRWLMVGLATFVVGAGLTAWSWTRR